MNPKILLKIDRLGNPTIDAQNFNGGKCKAVTESLVAKLGCKSESVVDKPELHMCDFTEQAQEQHIGG